MNIHVKIWLTFTCLYVFSPIYVSVLFPSSFYILVGTAFGLLCTNERVLLFHKRRKYRNLNDIHKEERD